MNYYKIISNADRPGMWAKHFIFMVRYHWKGKDPYWKKCLKYALVASWFWARRLTTVQ